MTFQEKMTTARGLLNKHGLPEWHLSIENINNFHRFTHRVSEPFGFDGGCSHENQTIYVDSMCQDGHFRQTVLHEIAHAVTPEDNNHGKEWSTAYDSIRAKDHQSRQA
jgi:hypothetical protein